MKHFNTYDVWIKPTKMVSAAEAKKLGFVLKNQRLFREMKTTEDMSKMLSSLHKKRIGIADVKVKRPSLEDYFIKLSK